MFKAASVDVVSAALAEHGYLADQGLATAIFLALTLPRPLLLEGEAGVGKTEVAKVLARWTGGELLRLQWYGGIEGAQAALPLPLGRAPALRTRSSDRRTPRSRRVGATGPPGGGCRRGHARPRAVQAAGGGRNDRLGPSAGRARPRRPRERVGGRDA